MRNLGLCLIVLWPASLLAQPDLKESSQPKDSLKTLHLEEIVVSNEAIDGVKGGKGMAGTTEDVSHYLRKLNGIDLVNRGMYASEPVYRGMSGSRSPVTINNMKIFGACTDKMDPVSSYVSVNNLKSITIVKDAGSGNSMASTSGVIAFKTKTPVFNDVSSWTGQIGTGFKSVNNEYNGQFSTAYNASKWAMRLNGTYRKAGNFVAGGGAEVEFSQYEKSNIAFSTSYLANENTLINAEYIFDLANNVGYPALPMDVSAARGNICSLSLNKYYANSQLEAKLYGNNIFHEMDDSQRTVVMHMDMPGWSDTYGAFANWTVESERSKWTTTVDYYLNQARAEMTMYPDGEIPMYMLTWPDVQKNSISLAASNDRQLSEILNLVTSIRLEVGTNRIKDEFGVKQLQAIGILGVTGNDFLLPSVSATLVASTTENTQLNVSMSYSQRQADVSEGFGYYLFNNQDNYDYIGDPRLSVESNFKIEGGFSLNKKALQFNLQAYGYYIPNYIIGEIREGYSAMTIGASGVKFYINLPYAYMYGLETGFGVQLTKTLHFSTQAQFTQGYDSEGLPLPLLPPLKNATQINYEKSNWQLGIELRSAVAQNNPRTEFGESATPGYAILNMNVGYEFNISKASVQVAVQAENLFDQYYWDHLDFTSIPRPGRSINFSLLIGL